ncbi:hypothetical protein brsh051_07880 [Brooklawnia propionicigenes]|uniref:Uncharacterized protein n=1 Tax=Brooklawnia propionicigenes TaxID=3041175 RepID=A0AAN0K920_9ACTN|nr:hypothetical protein brsh051_07880 [Brooklawnia sp. SH051]
MAVTFTGAGCQAISVRGSAVLWSISVMVLMPRQTVRRARRVLRQKVRRALRAWFRTEARGWSPPRTTRVAA